MFEMDFVNIYDESLQNSLMRVFIAWLLSSSSSKRSASCTHTRTPYQVEITICRFLRTSFCVCAEVEGTNKWKRSWFDDCWLIEETYNYSFQLSWIKTHKFMVIGFQGAVNPKKSSFLENYYHSDWWRHSQPVALF